MGGSGKPLTHGIQVLCYSQTWDCATYLSFPEGKEMLMPGEDANINLRMNKQFTLRGGGTTIASGKVTKVNDNMTEAEHAYMKANKKQKDKMLAAGKVDKAF